MQAQRRRAWLVHDGTRSSTSTVRALWPTQPAGDSDACLRPRASLASRADSSDYKPEADKTVTELMDKQANKDEDDETKRDFSRVRVLPTFV